MVDAPVLITCLENYVFLAARGGLRGVSYPGVRGHVSGLPHPLTNLVGAALPGAAIPESSLDAVFTEFAGSSLPFVWLLGPHTPEGTRERLRRRGMTPFQQLSGLATCELDLPPVGVAQVREVQADERDRFAAVLLESFEIEREVVDFLARHYVFAPSLRTRNYLAFVDGRRDPAAVASSVYDPDVPVVTLAIAAVTQPFRGRGLYRELVRRRLADAKADGLRAAVVHAHPESARICRRLGFRELCTQELMRSR